MHLNTPKKTRGQRLNFVYIPLKVLVFEKNHPGWRALSEKCPYLELFWSLSSRIRTVIRISSYSVRMQENTDQNIFKYGHFLRIVGWRPVQNPIKHLRLTITVNYFLKTLHLRCLIGFWICLLRIACSKNQS